MSVHAAAIPSKLHVVVLALLKSDRVVVPAQVYLSIFHFNNFPKKERCYSQLT